ncbi:MAG: glutamyl-tRNA reductase, partial [Mucispirillum sp.]|nr:glutamyl-tRNA reductase [Mucispirillum sp.]
NYMCENCSINAPVCDKCDILNIMAKNCSLPMDELSKYTYFVSGREAIRHIFSVASGLDSLVLGEPQIFGQVKDAFENAKKFGGTKAFLNKLFEWTIKTAKSVRTETGISENPVSVSYAAVELAKKIFSDLKEAKAMIVGAGEMCELAARHLVGSSIGGIIVTNRTFEKAVKLAEEFNGDAVTFDRFAAKLCEVDIVISSTGAEGFVITAQMIKDAVKKRKSRPMFFIDIAVPRDIDPAASDIENIYVYDIDDLKNVVEANKKVREKEAKKGWEIVNACSDAFLEQQESLKIVPVIKNLRLYFDEKRREELEKYCCKYKITDEKEIERLNYLLTSVFNKVLHTPFSNLKEHAADGSKYSVAEAIDIVFGNK